MIAALAALMLEAADPLARLQAFALDPKIREVSGLAPAGARSVLAHDDEFAIIHEVSLEDGRILRSFAFGKPTASGDFEGIAAIGDAIWLVTSDGRLFEGRLSDHGKRTRFHVYDTGVGEECEIEGLAPASDAGRFYLLCKNILKGRKDRLKIFEWSLADRFAAPKIALDAALSAAAPAGTISDFRPSDLVYDPATDHFLVLNASGGVLEITRVGAPVRYVRLDRALHPQPEGLALMRDGRIVIGDEGVRREGTLAVFRWR